MYKIKTTELGNDFFTVKHGDKYTVNFYINKNYDQIPSDKVVYDFFNSGELFHNLPQNSKIMSAAESLGTIYNAYVMGEDNVNFIKNPNPDISTLPHWVKRYVDDRLNGWIFDASLIFHIEETLIDYPICKHFTGQGVVSPNYHFANIPLNSTICSNSKVYISKTVPHSCRYSSNTSSSNFSKCPFYEYNYHVIKSISLNFDTEKQLDLELRYSKLANNIAIYQVYDLTHNQINYTIKSDDTPEFSENALLVLNEIVSSYETCKDISPSNVAITKNKSYILSLV